ncbi:MAG: 3',5'-cyclic-nucleotide phosphodiesterase [Rhodocyclaceae bacterium]|nr:MAG: 3',5'-cyclic-nucleotide phosphodiesterase [Rhodocyclaceae bacterium]
MKVRILGCSGGIGGRHLRTTSLLVDHDVLIDAGTGVADLSIAELAQIDHVFLTHTHLDHIACLPLLIDTVADMRNQPLVVHAIAPIIEILRSHIFNWAIWPDFSEIPNADNPFLRFQEIEVDTPVDIGHGRSLTPLPANHTVPAVAYALSAQKTLVFSGDTATCPPLWARVNRMARLDYLIIECAFSNREAALAATSKHFCPAALAQELTLMQQDTELFITHLKPGQVELTMLEIEEEIGNLHPKMLQNNQVFEL